MRFPINNTTMKKFILMVTVMVATMGSQAQTNMSGRVYFNDNIMEKEIQNMTRDIDKEIADARAKGIKKVEEKKGRKLTKEEMAKLEKELAEAQKMAEALKKGMKTTITLTFKDEKNLEMDVDMKIDDDVMKAAGVSWAKRKMIKLATKIMPTQKGTYTVNGNQIYVDEGGTRDTMSLSDDGKFLYGKLDDKKKFKLTRIK